MMSPAGHTTRQGSTWELAGSGTWAAIPVAETAMSARPSRNGFMGNLLGVKVGAAPEPTDYQSTPPPEAHGDVSFAPRLQRWAADDLRSLNAQIEFLLRKALQEEGRL